MPTDFTHDLRDDSHHDATDHTTDDELRVVGVPIPPEVPIPSEIEAPVNEEPIADASGAGGSGAALTPKRKSKLGLWLFLALAGLGGSGFLYLKKSSSPSDVTPMVNQGQPQRLELSHQTLRLKALWNEGAVAKRNGDYALARKKWAEGIRIDPSNRGFQESLKKLYKLNGKNSGNPAATGY